MAAKEYVGGGSGVSYDPDVCIHAAECVRALPKVFDPQARPWIRPDQAEPEDVRAAVGRCPSGALQFRPMQPPAPPSPAASGPTAVKVQVNPNGPYLVMGPVTVCDPTGAVLKQADRIALCRCGNSGAKPFCDGSHGRLGWRS